MFEIDSIYQGKIRKLRNLAAYKGMSDEEIYKSILLKEGEKKVKELPSKTDNLSYDARYKRLIDKLQSEYGIDMNESNDAESLKMLVKHTLQLESVDKQINTLNTQAHMSAEDSRTLKNLSDVQRSLMTSVKELSNDLGISRKTRKEKQIDDVPLFIEALKNKAATFWDRKTIQVRCETCKIELGRVWLNFPHLKSEFTASWQCDKCMETTVYVR